MFAWFRRWRRKKWAKVAFPESWMEILQRRFPLYGRLREEDQRELQFHIQWFVAEKRFEGCDGLSVTDEMRVTIAAQACLLVLNRSPDAYDGLRSILLYPSAYFARSTRPGPGNLVMESETQRLGESWDHGTVVLAWDSVRGGADNPFDGRNVVFHEFAHQLDQEDGKADGAPVLGRDQLFSDRIAAYSSWARVMSKKYAQLQRRTTRGRKTVLDAYGATHPAEFFAVATEAFFEKPRKLRRKHPKLYQELAGFYRQDPAEWAKSAHDDKG